MDVPGGDKASLFDTVAGTDAPEIAGDALANDGDQRRIDYPLLSGLGRLSVGEHFSGVIAAGQAQAYEFLDHLRRLRGSARSGAVAIQGYGRSLPAATSRAFNKVRSVIHSTPEAVVDHLCLVAMGGLALLGATDWDTRRDRLERYTLLPGEKPYYWGNPRPPQLPVQRQAVHRPLSSEFPPVWVNRLRAYQAAASQQAQVDHHPPTITEELADLHCQHLVQLMSGTHVDYSSWKPIPSFAAMSRRASTTTAERAAPTYRQVQIRNGVITMIISGPTAEVDARIGAYTAAYPGTVILSNLSMIG